jgi:hypothetical protein
LRTQRNQNNDLVWKHTDGGRACCVLSI